MRVVDSSTGWMSYVRTAKEKAGEGAILDYKILMQQYIRGVKIEPDN